LLKLENKCENLTEEIRKVKSRRDEGRNAVSNMTKMMKEVEERSAEGAMEREKEIERLQQRCKVLGEAVGRLSGSASVEQKEDPSPTLSSKVTYEDEIIKGHPLSAHELWFDQRNNDKKENEDANNLNLPAKLRAAVKETKRQKGGKKKSRKPSVA